MNPFTRQRKALPNNVREKIEDDYWHKIKANRNRKRAETRQTVSSIVDNFVRKGHVEAGKGGNKIRYARTDDVINYAEYCKQTLTCLRWLPTVLAISTPKGTKSELFVSTLGLSSWHSQ